MSRRIPGALRVRIAEAEPVALAERGGRLVLLDAAGRVLPFDPSIVAADLPVADTDSGVARLLSRIRETDPRFFGRIERGLKWRTDVALDLPAGRVLFRTGASADEIRDLLLVEQYLTQTGKRWKELDARFASRVFVRGMGA
ncbi:MAG: hypothetical protein HOP28_06030 [Gemmatimonadales bacterium]|nr:hypothetical protein [Gemmatimonadales bacterium]